MVKNSTGGNKSKGFARKNLVKRDNALRVAHEEGEIYAQAIKVMGGSIVSVMDINGNTLRGHIRGKFRGRGKRDNFISPGTWLLVGLHEWGSECNDCDILEVYSETDKNRLKSSVTGVNWSKFIANDNKLYDDNTTKSTPEDSGVTFMDEETQEYEQLIASQAKASIACNHSIIPEDNEVITIDDI